ncbi:CRISPR-associated protein Cas5 [Frankia sp. AgKG'84/4]|uniref:CRISPR-associated protein Cas5 n=1 Tax=Frankia sp. AgKG'84/4 TaxID=573490 RepID=UPI00200F239A|nr:CRISPR-associated protein Cas5 [Frankia sp. AgKG'84/4]MCL9793803.1 CRISPR-associated protein Cas5 [Frankia sp. AgKG'84/4]
MTSMDPLVGGVVLEVTVTAPVVSFRDPLFSSVAPSLPCPPPSTVGGLLAAVAGGWDVVDRDIRFGMAFTARATGVDLETYHPLLAGKWGDPVPRDRHFLYGAELTIWLVDDVERWARRFRRPVWPLRLGRSQDLATARTLSVCLHRGQALTGGALVADDASGARGHGLLMQLPTAISRDRARIRWGAYRHHPSVGSSAGTTRSSAVVDNALATADGRLVHLLSSVHPWHAENQRPR